MNRLLTRSLCAAAAALLLAGSATDSQGQCSTCTTPAAAPVTVGYAPTVTLQPYSGWYPGKLFDRWRLRRWERSTATTTAAYAPAPTYAASYAPTYTAAYAPTASTAHTPYNVGYAYRASYSPYVTAYAPLRRTSYYQPAVLRPVVAYSPVVADAGCASCGGCEPCSSCSSCSSGVAQAAYAAPAGGCASCAAAGGTPSYDYGYGAGAPAAAGSTPYYGEPTPRPELSSPPTPAPADSSYQTQRPPVEAAPAPAATDPGPAADDDVEASMYPRLLSPVNDRTARRPSVDVWNAVYRKPAVVRPTSLREPVAAPAPRQRTQTEIDADPWTGVSR